MYTCVHVSLLLWRLVHCKQCIQQDSRGYHWDSLFFATIIHYRTFCTTCSSYQIVRSTSVQKWWSPHGCIIFTFICIFNFLFYLKNTSSVTKYLHLWLKYIFLVIGFFYCKSFIFPWPRPGANMAILAYQGTPKYVCTSPDEWIITTPSYGFLIHLMRVSPGSAFCPRSVPGQEISLPAI